MYHPFLKDSEFLDFCMKKNNEAQELTSAILKESGFDPIKSYTSFALFEIPESPQSFLPKMEAKGVGVRGWSFADKHWCRVSMGTMDEMKMFGTALNQVL